MRASLRRLRVAALPVLLSSGLAAAAQACSESEPIHQVTSATGTGGGAGGTAGTGGGAGGTGGLGCDPIVPTQCGYPFPSNVYLSADPSTPTGHRVAFPEGVMPTMTPGGHVDPAPWGRSDGFSPGQAPLTDLPGATVTGLPTQDTIELSLTADSPTILMEADTLARVPHFAELDVSSASGEGDHAFMIRPVVRLKDATRYIVAIRHVVDAHGDPVAPSPAFQALRDGTSSPEPSVASRRALYADVLGKLAAAGVAKDDLQIAWDYTTASRENNTSALLHMRDDALAKVGAAGPPYAIDSVDTDPNPHIRLRIHGHMTVPLYLDQPGPGGRLVLGPDGLPAQNGTADYPFLVHVPNSAKQGSKLAILQNGHGLFGDETEGQDDYLAQICDENGFIGVTVDLVGASAEDYDDAMQAFAGDVGQFGALVDRQHQGILNSLLVMRLMRGAFAEDPAVRIRGASVIDREHAYYRGDGQGGIFGATYLALSTDVTRGLLGEPGMPFDLLLDRSEFFDPFFSALEFVYQGGRQAQLVLGLIQMLWDRTEPDGYAPYIVDDVLPGTPKHQLLLHVAIGDHQVTPLGAHILARAVNAQDLAPVNRSVFGLPAATAPFGGSGIVEWSFGLPAAPETDTPPEGTLYPDGADPHTWVRGLDAARSQTESFLRTGMVNQVCGGPCVFPEP